MDIEQLMRYELISNLMEIVDAISRNLAATGVAQYDPSTLSFQIVWGMMCGPSKKDAEASFVIGEPGQ